VELISNNNINNMNEITLVIHIIVMAFIGWNADKISISFLGKRDTIFEISTILLFSFLGGIIRLLIMNI